MKARSRTILHVAEQVAVRLDPSRSKLDAKGEALIRKMGPAFGRNLRAGVRRPRGAAPPSGTPIGCSKPSGVVAETDGLKLGDVMQPIRVALTGSTVSEPVNELLAVVGREQSLRRLKEIARVQRRCQRRVKADASAGSPACGGAPAPKPHRRSLSRTRR